MENNNERIDGVTAGFMVVVAVFFDVLSIVPGLNIISLVIGGATFALWFKLRGIGLISPKKVAVWGVGGLVEAFPAISALPSFVVGVILIIAIVRAEDRFGIAIPLPGKTKFGERGKISGGRSKIRKKLRRATQSREHRRRARERLLNMRRIREERSVAEAPKQRSASTTLSFPTQRNEDSQKKAA